MSRKCGVFGVVPAKPESRNEANWCLWSGILGIVVPPFALLLIGVRHKKYRPLAWTTLLVLATAALSALVVRVVYNHVQDAAGEHYLEAYALRFFACIAAQLEWGMFWAMLLVLSAFLIVRGGEGLQEFPLTAGSGR